MTNALILHIDYIHDLKPRSPQACLQEVVTLSKAISLNVCHEQIIKLRSIKSGYIFSKNRLDMIEVTILDTKPDILIINGAVSPIQQRNLEKKLKIKIKKNKSLASN